MFKLFMYGFMIILCVICLGMMLHNDSNRSEEDDVKFMNLEIEMRIVKDSLDNMLLEQEQLRTLIQDKINEDEEKQNRKNLDKMLKKLENEDIQYRDGILEQLQKEEP